MGLKGILYRKVIYPHRRKTLEELRKERRYYKGKELVEKEKTRLKTDIKAIRGDSRLTRGVKATSRGFAKVAKVTGPTMKRYSSAMDKEWKQSGKRKKRKPIRTFLPDIDY